MYSDGESVLRHLTSNAAGNPSERTSATALVAGALSCKAD